MPDLTMRGVYPILSTPFDEKGNIVFDDLENQVDWIIDQGVDGVGIAMASEVFKFTEQERDAVLRSVVDTASGRVKVVMNTGAEGTDATIYYSKRAEELGADALMIRPTSYIPTTAAEHIEFFVRIAGSVNIPIFLQDQSTAPVPPAMAVACARRHENLCYIKVETPPTIPRMAEAQSLTRDGTDLVLFGGMGGAFFLEELRRGSVGTMPGSTLPDKFVQIWELWESDDEAGALDAFDRYASIIRTLAQGQGLANWIYKHIMWRRGVFSRDGIYARGPSLRPDSAHLREVDDLLDRVGLLEVSG